LSYEIYDANPRENSLNYIYQHEYIHKCPKCNVRVVTDERYPKKIEKRVEQL